MSEASSGPTLALTRREGGEVRVGRVRVGRRGSSSKTSNSSRSVGGRHRAEAWCSRRRGHSRAKARAQRGGAAGTELAGARGVVTAELASAASPERSRTESGAEGRPLGAGASIGEDDPAAGGARSRRARTHARSTVPSARERCRAARSAVGACVTTRRTREITPTVVVNHAPTSPSVAATRRACRATETMSSSAFALDARDSRVVSRRARPFPNPARVSTSAPPPPKR